MLYYNCIIRVHIAIPHTDIEREEFEMKKKNTNVIIIAYDVLNHVEIYHGQDPDEAEKEVDRYCDFMGLPDDASIRIEVIYL